MKIRLFSVSGFMLGLFCSINVQAQNPPIQKTNGSLPDTLVSIEEVTVHAFRYESRLLEAPVAISIISASQLELNSMRPIDDVLNQVPGVYMQSGSLSTNRLTIRGVGSRSPYASNKIRAYYAGIPLTNGVGETTVEDLNRSVLSKVEVIKGPASGFYGSGLGGTLLFEAAHPTQSQFSAGYSLASYQTHQLNGQFILAGENNRNLFAVENLNSQGYRENNQTDRLNLNYIGWLKAGKHEFNFIVNHTKLKAYIPSSLDLETYTNSPKKAASNWAATRGYEDYGKSLFGVSMDSKWMNDWKSTISLFGQMRNSEELRPFNLLEEDSHYIGGRFVIERKIITPHANWKLMLGNESFFEGYNWSTFKNNDRKKGDRLTNNREKRNYINIFGQIEYRPTDRLRIWAGANFNKTAYQYSDLFLNDGDQSGDYTFKSMISPRLAINYSLPSNHSFYGQISQGFSPPSLEETLLPNGGRNPNIEPETGWNFEIGSRGYLFEGLFYDLSVYYMRISNLLVAQRVAEDAYLGINAGKTAHPGLEYYLQYRVPTETKTGHYFTINGDFSPYYFIDFVDGEGDYSGNDLTGVPRHNNNFSYQLKVNKTINFQLIYRHVGRMPLRDDNSIYSDPYGLLSANCRYEKVLGKVIFKAMAVAENLTNEHYSSMVLINASSFGGNAPRYYYPGMPLNFSFQIKLSYLI